MISYTVLLIIFLTLYTVLILDRPVTPWLRRIADLGVSIGSADSIENVKGVKLTNEESHFAAVEWAKFKQ